MEYRVLGVFEALDDGLPVSLGGPKQRSVLAMLLLDANRAVSTDRLVDGLWGDDPPVRAAATLQVYVSNLRKALEPDRSRRAEPSVLLTQAPGYLFAVDPDQIDLFRFEQLVEVARSLAADGCPAGASVVFQEALALWREAPLADLAHEPFAGFEVPRLEEARTGAIEGRIDAALALGRDVELLPELEALVARHPYRERLRGQLMLALYRAGRQADALAAFQAARRELVDELGLEPGRELRELEAAILVHDPALAPLAVAPITPEQVARVLAAVNRAEPDDAVVAAVVEEGHRSARSAEEALQRAVDEEQSLRLAVTVESVSASQVELTRGRRVIAERVLDRRTRVAPRRSRPRGSVVASRGPGGAELCPYKGLLRFEPEDSGWYFGRERLVAELLASVASTRCTALVGASGSGKSSLTRAGLLAALRDDALPGSAHWPRLLVTPGADPMLEFARVLAAAAHTTSPERVRDRLVDDPESLTEFAARATNGADGDRPLVIVVDQLEEAFTVCADDTLRNRFLDVLVHAAANPDSPTRVVAAIRADYYGRCAEHPAFAEALGNANVLVGPMRPDELLRTIEEPARRAGLSLEDGLVDRIFDDVGTEPGSLPLLETALLETWNRRSGTTLTLDGYSASGGVRGAVAHLADGVYARLGQTEQDIARGIFLRLAEPGVGTDDVRRRAPLDELLVDDDHAAVLATLVDRRLVVTNDATAEVAHEALLREWPRLRTWLDEDREGRRVQRALSNAAQDWALGARDDALLFRGSRLSAALDVASAHPAEVNPLERDFLVASRTQQESELNAARRTARRFRRLTAALAVLLLVAIVAGGLAVVEQQRADDHAHRADAVALDAQVSDISTLARTLPAGQVDLALLLGMESYRLQPSAKTEGALETALNRTPRGLERALRLDSPSLAPGIAPGGHTLAVPRADGTVQLLSLPSLERVRVLRGRDERAAIARFRADGDRVVAGGAGGAVHVWDVATGRLDGKPLSTHGDFAFGFFDPSDSARLFTVAADGATGSVVLWDRHDPDHPVRVGEPYGFAVERNAIPVTAISSDGSVLVAGSSAAGSTAIFDVRAQRPLQEVDGVPGGFVPETHTLATVEQGQIVLRDALTGLPNGAPLTGFNFPTSAIANFAARAVAFTADGTRLAALDGGGGIRVFDVVSRSQIGLPLGLDTRDRPVGFLADGRLLTTGGDTLGIWRVGVADPPFAVGLLSGYDAVDEAPTPQTRGVFIADTGDVITEIWVDPGVAAGPLLRWDASTGALRGPVLPGARNFMSVSPDGEYLTAPSGATEFGIWSLATGERIASFGDGRAFSVIARWSPSTDMVATASNEQRYLVVWDVSEPRHPVRLRELRLEAPPSGFRDVVVNPRWSADGRRIAALDYHRKSVTVFDVASGREIWSQTMGRTLGQVTFSPDGKTLAVVTRDEGGFSELTLWDTTTWSPRRSVALPGVGGHGVEFLRRGELLLTTSVVTGGSDSSGAGGSVGAQLWDATTLERIGEPLLLDANTPGFVERDPRGDRAVIGARGRTLLVWDVDRRHWHDLACRIAGRNLTRAEWARYLPGRTYHATCGRWTTGE